MAIPQAETLGGEESSHPIDSRISHQNPHAKHEYSFTNEQAHQALQVLQVMKGSEHSQEAIEKLGLTPESQKILKELSEKTLMEYTDFWVDRVKIFENTVIPPEDKGMLLPKEMTEQMNLPPGTTQLWEEVQSLVARYLVQKQPSLNFTEDDMYDALDVVSEGLERYYRVYQVDIPLYDVLYDEFDQMRRDGRSPLRVYMGRDGIYAYLGDRAQDVARRRQLGWQERKRLKEEGNVLELHPQYQYLVYPTLFKDTLPQDLKERYLAQEGITSEVDAVFSDTGYRGTTPEDIMRVMGFPQDEINSRIKLLLGDEDRMVAGLRLNSKKLEVEYIERNAKPVKSATGLYEEDGILRPIEEPSSPEDQFYFQMIRQAIVRHYWIKEHTPPEQRTPVGSYELKPPEKYEKLSQYEISKQCSKLERVYKKTGVVQELSSGEFGIVGIDGKEYPMPTLDEVHQKLAEQEEILAPKMEQGFRKILIVPFGMPVENLIEIYGNALISHKKAGKLSAPKKDFLDLADPPNLMIEEPVRIFPSVLKALSRGEIVYNPTSFTNAPEGHTKNELLASEDSAWQILLVEDLPILPKINHSAVIGGRSQISVGQSPDSYLQMLQNDPAYASESGMNLETWLSYALIHLEETDEIIDDKDVQGNMSYLLGSYIPSEKQVLKAYWDRGFQSTVISYAASNVGRETQSARTVVKVA